MEWSLWAWTPAWIIVDSYVGLSRLVCEVRWAGLCAVSALLWVSVSWGGRGLSLFLELYCTIYSFVGPLVVQWLRFRASTATGAGSIPDWGTQSLMLCNMAKKIFFFNFVAHWCYSHPFVLSCRTWLHILLHKSSSVELFWYKHLFYAVNLDVFQGLIIDEPVLPFKSKIWLIDDADETS